MANKWLLGEQEIINMSEDALDEYLKKILAHFDDINMTPLKNCCAFLKNRYEKSTQKFLPGTSMYDFLVRFFGKYHKEWDEKTHGYDVDYFCVEPAPQQSSHCFFLYIDGIGEDIGYSTIAKKYNIINDIKKACREAIKPIILDFKKKMSKKSGLKCPITGKELNVNNMTVHHENLEFNDIVEKWVEEHGGANKIIKYVNETVGNGTITQFTDKDLIEDFVDYHNKKTEVCVLSKEGHSIRHKELKNRNASPNDHSIVWYKLPINKRITM